MSPSAPHQASTHARKVALACAASTAFAASSCLAASFAEVGDAGQTPALAQVTSVGGDLTDIFGTLSSSLDADLYVIRIANPGAFSATTLNAVGGFLDTQLFLLTLAGAPVALNDDDAGGLSTLSTLSTLPAGSSFGTLTAGFYLLGVSVSGLDPVNINGQLLFENGLPTSVRGPAADLQPALLGSFADNTFFADSGTYDIQLTGALAAVPEPSTSLMLLAGGALAAFGTRRRRRAMTTPDTEA
jgi:PEP-CTERM motif